MDCARRKDPNLLGRGTYGEVFRTEIIKDDGTVVKAALKKFYYKHNISGFGNIREIDIYNRARSDFIPSLEVIDITPYEYKPREWETDEKNRERREEFVTVISELAISDGQNFFKRESYSVMSSLRMSAQLLMAVDHLHKRGICHRDIKSSNVLIFLDDNGQPQLKLCDFGFSNFVTKNTHCTPNIHTPWYRAPEVAWGANDYKITSDIWCVGCTIYEIFTGDVLMSRSGNGDSLRNFFEECLRVVPNEWTVEVQSMYRRFNTITPDGELRIGADVKIFGSSAIRPIEPKARSFMRKFRSLRKRYQIKDDPQWECGDRLIRLCLNFDYKARSSSEVILKNECFNEIQSYIDESLNKQNRPRVNEEIIISIPERLNQAKISFFSESSERLSNLSPRTFFHAVDLANRVLTAYPNSDMNLDNIFACCLYFSNKYNSILIYPEPPENFFFRTFNAVDFERETFSEEKHRELDKLIYDFEILVVTKEVLVGFRTYRPGLFEMQEHYGHFLTVAQLTQFFGEFLRIDQWSGKSFRYMYRLFYNRFIDDSFVVDVE